MLSWWFVPFANCHIRRVPIWTRFQLRSVAAYLSELWSIDNWCLMHDEWWLMFKTDAKRNNFKCGNNIACSVSTFEHKLNVIIVSSPEWKGNGKNTKRDGVVNVISKHDQNDKLRHSFCHFVVEHEVDTDCIENDVELFHQEKESNLHSILGKSDSAMNAVRRFVRHDRIMGNSFATGYPLFYWKWYRTASKQDIKGNVYLSLLMDLGGHSVQELSVEPHFANLKEEVLATGLVGGRQFEKLVMQKAKRYLKSAKCRKMKCLSFSTLEDDPLHFDIPRGTPLTEQHLQSIILYCDFTKLCTLFSQSLRKDDPEDGLEEIKAKNSKFFYFTKLLRELVTYFGGNGGGVLMNGVASGPFYSGVSVVLNLNEFSIGFNTPTSTSKTKEIAWRFAGEEGMLITVGNQRGGWSKYQPVFNATWISAYCEEDEYLWFGSVYRLSVEAVSIVYSRRTYRMGLNALHLFGALLSGQSTQGLTMKRREQQILNFCFSDTLGVACIHHGTKGGGRVYQGLSVLFLSEYHQNTIVSASDLQSRWIFPRFVILWHEIWRRDSNGQTQYLPLIDIQAVSQFGGGGIVDGCQFSTQFVEFVISSEWIRNTRLILIAEDPWWWQILVVRLF